MTFTATHQPKTLGLTPLTAATTNDNLLSTKGALASPLSFPGSVARAPCALCIDTAVIVDE